MKLSPARRNAAASYFNFIVVAVAGIIVSPMLAGALGAAAFGVWKSCQKAMDFATVADGRASQALKWIIAYRSGETDENGLRRSIGASVTVWVILLPVLTSIAALIAYVVPNILSGVPESEIHTAHLVAAILGLNVVLTALLSIPDSVLVGTNQGYRSMVVTTFALVCVNVAMVVAVQHGWGVASLAVLTVAGAVINAAITFVVARRHVSWLGIRRPARGDVRRFVGFSGWVMTWSFVTKIYLATELLLFGSLVGVTAAAHFTFTNYVLTFGLSACLMTGSAFMPQLGRALGAAKSDSAQHSIRDAREVTLALAVVCAGMVLAVNGTFVDVWIGPSYYLGDSVNALMTLAFLQLALIRNEAQIQDTGLNIRNKVLVGLTGAVLSAGLAFALYQASHSLIMLYVGLMAGRLVPSVIFPRLVARLAPDTGGTARTFACAVGMLVPCYLIGLAMGDDGLLALVAVSAVVASGLLAVTYFVLLSPPVRTKVRQTVKA